MKSNCTPTARRLTLLVRPRSAILIGMLSIPAVVLAAECWKADLIGYPCAAAPPVQNCWSQLVTDSICHVPTMVSSGHDRSPESAPCVWEWKTLDALGGCTVTHTNYTQYRDCHTVNSTKCGGSGGES
ncbi:MAG: hypothetical protein HBSAPP03_17330 [Phycisphaerae bacterium]|nr:MAG: hypothetical protein HBSAPP03_17330 [Phycisphaerae bacterium]